MATWELIESTGRMLVRLLQTHVDEVMPLAGVRVQLATTKLFRTLETTSQPTLTVFLYRALENPELRNSKRRVLPDGTTSRPLLPLELCYLVTPWGVRRDDSALADENAAREEHRLLGVALQAFYDHAEVSRAELVEDPGSTVWEAVDSVQLVLESLPVEDHYRIWDAGELDYRLSLTYRVRVIGLEPSTSDTVPPVATSTQHWKPGLV